MRLAFDRPGRICVLARRLALHLADPKAWLADAELGRLPDEVEEKGFRGSHGVLRVGDGVRSGPSPGPWTAPTEGIARLLVMCGGVSSAPNPSSAIADSMPAVSWTCSIGTLRTTMAMTSPFESLQPAHITYQSPGGA